MTPTSSKELPEEIASLRRLIFDHSEGLEHRLRIFVACLRQANDIYQKAYYTDIIEDIYKDAITKATEALLDNIEAELPEEKDSNFERSLKVIGWPEQYVKGYNQALKDVRTRLTTLRRKHE